MTVFRRLGVTAFALCALVVVFGAYVRLSDAGLGCPDWPGCYGHLTVPTDAGHVEQAQQAYPDRPVHAPKAWKEMIHRYLASTLGLLILGLAALSFRRDVPHKALPRVLVGLVLFQGLLGMWTVTWLLKPLAVTGHLLGGMSTLALLFWLNLELRRGDGAPMRADAALRALAAAGLAAVALQIALGGWTSSNYAALACPDLPTCQGHWWPDMDAREAFTLWRGLGTSYEGGVLNNPARMTIHVAHRIGALVVTGLVLALLLALRRRGARWNGYAAALGFALAAQLCIGVSLILLQLPLPLADAHNAGAALLLLAMIALNHRVWKGA